MTLGSDIAKTLARVVDRDIRVMHVCGTHEAAIAKYGIRSVLPPQMKIVMGPGCPVCITPQGEIDAAADIFVDINACVWYAEYIGAVGETAHFLIRKDG